jgi:FAD/FMN-containing dehydrogenase
MTSPSPEALNALKAAAGPGGWTDDPAEIAPWLKEWRNRWSGHTPLMLTPRSTEEVARLVATCAEHRVAIVPQGGATGLVGGQVPFGEVLLSLRKMRAVRDVTPLDDAMTVEAGVTLLEAQQAAAAAGRMFPLSLAAEGSATIGGVISTNAGGTAVIRYGVMRDLVLGIEAVLPNGEIFRGLKRLRKDNTGYDLKQLLIGAEGTLGVVTAATLKLFPVMRSRATAILAGGVRRCRRCGALRRGWRACVHCRPMDCQHFWRRSRAFLRHPTTVRWISAPVFVFGVKVLFIAAIGGQTAPPTRGNRSGGDGVERNAVERLWADALAGLCDLLVPGLAPGADAQGAVSALTDWPDQSDQRSRALSSSSLALTQPPALPSAACSFFQNGADVFRKSMTKLAPSKAACRCGEAVTTRTMFSPGSILP